MDATNHRDDQQLVREARIGISAIAGAIVLFFGVAIWRLGPFALPSSPPPSPVSRSADVPVDIASRSKPPRDRRAQEPEFLLTAEYEEPSQDGSSPAVQAAFEQPSVEPRRNSSWPLPNDPVNFVPNPNSLEGADPPNTIVDPRMQSPGDQPPSSFETRDVQLNRIPTGDNEEVSQQNESKHVAPAPVGANPAAVIIGPGDTFFKIAERVYGDGAFYKALYQHNRDRYRRPDRLPIGSTVNAPPMKKLRELYPGLCPLE